MTNRRQTEHKILIDGEDQSSCPVILANVSEFVNLITALVFSKVSNQLHLVQQLFPFMKEGHQLMGLQDACAVVSTWMSFPPIVGTATLGSDQLKTE